MDFLAVDVGLLLFAEEDRDLPLAWEVVFLAVVLADEDRVDFFLVAGFSASSAAAVSCVDFDAVVGTMTFRLVY